MIKMEYKSLHFSKSQTSILKHLYTILTDDNEILLILFNQIYCGKNNIKNVELSYDQKHLTLLIGDVDETSKNIIERKYTLNEEDFNIKKRKIKNYVNIKEDLTMIYYYKYIERKDKDNILIINSISNSQYNACLELEKHIKNTNIKKEEKLAIL